VRRIQRYLQSLRYAWLTRAYRIGPGGYRRIYFYHVRKAAGTSLNHMFLALGDEPGAEVYAWLPNENRTISNDKVFVGWSKRLIEQGYYFYAFSHLPMHAFTLPPDTYTFTCLRDPAQRVISHYKMLVKYRDNNVPHPCVDEEGPWLGRSFDDFLTNIPRQHLLNQLYMFSDSFDVDEAYANITGCNRFFFVQDFAKGVAGLAADLDLPLEPIHTRQIDEEPDIPAAATARLREMLAPEYDLCARLQEH
jgi:hypothetical protein